MERTTPVRKPNASTSDLLTWSETPPPAAAVSANRSLQVSLSQHSFYYHFSFFIVCLKFTLSLNSQPADKISKVLHGGQLTDEEARTLEKA